MGRVSYDRIQGEEAEKLDDLFGMKDCLIEVNPGRVLLPPQYQEIGDKIVNMKVRTDDVWLVSYPRTGKFTELNKDFLEVFESEDYQKEVRVLFPR